MKNQLGLIRSLLDEATRVESDVASEALLEKAVSDLKDFHAMKIERDDLGAAVAEQAEAASGSRDVKTEVPVSSPHISVRHESESTCSTGHAVSYK